MKQKTKRLPDVDRRGRVRRVPSEGPPPRVLIRFIDGPCAGQTRMLAVVNDTVTVAGLRYSYCGKERHVQLYAREPKSRILRAALMQLIRITGKDPRMKNAMLRESRKPVYNTGPSKAGRGARKRAAKRAG